MHERETELESIACALDRRDGEPVADWAARLVDERVERRSTDERVPFDDEQLRRSVVRSLARSIVHGPLAMDLDDITHDDDWQALDDDDFRCELAERIGANASAIVRIFDDELSRVYRKLDGLDAVRETPTASVPERDSWASVYADAMLTATDYAVTRKLHTPEGMSNNRTQCVDLVDRCAAIATRRESCAGATRTPAKRDGVVESAHSETSRERPSHYTSAPVETIDKVNAVTAGLPADAAWLLGNVIKYVDRAGKKLDAADDLSKAHDYAHRLVFGDWDQEV